MNYKLLFITILCYLNSQKVSSSNEREGYDDTTVFDFEDDIDGIPYNFSAEVLSHNTATFTNFLKYNASYSSLFFSDKTFHFYPGIYGTNITDLEITINGTIRFHRPPETLTNHYNRPEPGIFIEDSDGIFINSPVDKDEDGSIDYDYGLKKRGVIDGHGADYWGVPFIGYVELIEFRPDLFAMNRTSNVNIEYIIFRDAGLYTLHLVDVNNLEISYSSVMARRTNYDGHSYLDLSAFNTDGIDVSGSDIYIHDVDIWNQDDCIAVKDSFIGESTNMLFERITASGLGLTIGSIGATTVRNITFRDSLMYKTYKGIYMKFRHDVMRDGNGLVENILFENITIYKPEQYGIWIGPAQQAISANPCHASPCSLCWPVVPFTVCDGIAESQYKNITLKDIYIYDPEGTPGLILADANMPIENITFDNVVVKFNEVPEGLANADASILFYGFNEPIQDQFMHPALTWLYLFSFACLVAGILGGTGYGFIKLASSRRANSSGDEDKSEPLLDKTGAIDSNNTAAQGPGTFSKISLILAATCVIIAAVVQRIFKVSEQTYDQSGYFVCEGVVNGVATGATYPVPSCFTDETTSNLTASS